MIKLSEKERQAVKLRFELSPTENDDVEDVEAVLSALLHHENCDLVQYSDEPEREAKFMLSRLDCMDLYPFLSWSGQTAMLTPDADPYEFARLKEKYLKELG